MTAHSTLPDIFKTGNKIQHSPKKQSPLYSIQFHANPQQTKLLIPVKRKSANQLLQAHNSKLMDTLSNFKTSRYSNQKRRFNHSLELFSNTYRQFSPKKKNVHHLSYLKNTSQCLNVQDFDNIKLHINKVAKQLVILKNGVQSQSPFPKQFKANLSIIEQRFLHQISDIETNFQNACKQLRQAVSILRKQTGTEIKIFKKQINEINQHLVDSCQIIKDIQEHRIKIYHSHF